jgi:WD40 repeat protein
MNMPQALPKGALARYSTLATSTAGEVKVLQLTPDGKLLSASGAWLHLWDLKTHKVLAAYCEHQGGITELCYSPDKRWLATASWDNTVVLWDAVTMEVRHRLLKHKSAVMAVAFSYDSQRLFSACMGKQLLSWSVSDGALQPESYTLPDYLNELLCLQSELLIAGCGVPVQALDAKTLASRSVWKGFPKEPNGIRQSQKYFYSPGCNGALYWREISGGKVSSYKIYDDSCSYALLFADEDRVLTTGEDRTARVSRLSTKKELLRVELKSMSYAATLHPDEKSFFVAEESTIKQVETKSGAQLASFGASEAPTEAISQSKLSVDGATLFSAAYNACCAWRTATQALIWGFSCAGEISSFLLSADDSKLFLCVTRYNEATRWLVLNAKDGSVLLEKELPLRQAPKELLRLTEEHAMLVIGVRGLELRLSDGEIVKEHELPEGDFSWRKSKGLQVFAHQKEAILWDAKKKQRSALPVGKSYSFSIGDDEKTLIVGGWTGIISVWDLTTKKLLVKKKVSEGCPVVLWLQESKVLVGDQATGMYLYDYEKNKAFAIEGSSPATTLYRASPLQVIAGGIDGVCMVWEVSALLAATQKAKK